MNADITALRGHLRAEEAGLRATARSAQKEAARRFALRMSCPITVFERDADWYAAHARTATDAWLAADARLRALDGLIARCA